MSNDAYKEQLSALVDDELRREESAFLQRRLVKDDEAVAQLGRYFLISDTLRRQLPDTVDTGFAARITAALEAEPAHKLAPPGIARRLVRPLAGLGVAASAAMVAVSLWSPEPTGSAAPGGQAAFVAATAGPGPSAVSLVAQPENRWDRLDPQVQQRLNGYLVNHSEHSSTGQFGGVLKYVRIAGQQARD
jgi:sigma-E factor negative regulatory protein RseA